MGKGKEEQISMDISNNELILTESRTMRDEFVFKDEVLDKIKIVPQLPVSVEVTVEMAANYYDVPVETIKTIIKRHRDEFNEYGEIRILKSKALADFKDRIKGEVQLEPTLSTTSILTLLTRRGLLRVGMLLTQSDVAKSIRNYLLNVEEISTAEQKRWAIEREISKRERRQLTDAIQEFYNGSMKTGVAYSVFTNLVYEIVFDMNAQKLRESYGLDKNDPLRDALTTDDLHKVVKVEKTISSLLLIGNGFRDIKEVLRKNKEKFQ